MRIDIDKLHPLVRVGTKLSLKTDDSTKTAMQQTSPKKPAKTASCDDAGAAVVKVNDRRQKTDAAPTPSDNASKVCLHHHHRHHHHRRHL